MDRLLPRRLSREIEVAWGLALGFVFNGVLMIAQAEAGVISSAGQVFQTNAVAGALGGLTMALIHFTGQAFASERTPSHLKVKAAVEGVCAIVIGAIAAHYTTRQIGALLPKVNPADVLWLGWFIGVVAWRIMPGVIATAQALAQPRNLMRLALARLKAWVDQMPSTSSGDPS